MSDRDITEAYALLRNALEGAEPYAATVLPMARALIEHNRQVVYETLAPFSQLIAKAASRTYAGAIQITAAELIDTINEAALLRESPELREKLLPYMQGVAPLNAELVNKVAGGAFGEPVDKMLESKSSPRRE